MNGIKLNELTLDNVGQWPLTIKVCVLAGISLLILVLGYWFIIQDNFSQFEMLQAQEHSLKTDFESKQRQVYDLPAYRAQLQLMQQRFSLLLKQLPEKNEMPGLLEEVSKTGVTSGLKFELFAPQVEVIRDFYVELPIKISVVGRYLQLSLFIDRIAQMNRMVTLHDFSMEGIPSKDPKETYGDGLVMNVSAKIYRYRES